ncbi:hypothetical protein ONZ45_g18147 [Pleurotus djamor]|nr:hypothetical protein ONZ45_g18147 [Pleurotus djamor]
MIPPQHIAILGGGITGLSSAFHLSKKFPQALITLLEQKPKLGGWAQSERVHVKDHDGTPYSILLESGPRTLRPNAKSLLELIHLLGLKDSLVLTPKGSEAARKRYLYIPERRGLTPLPSSIPSLLVSPLRSLFFRAGIRDTFQPSLSKSDESVDAFLSRHLGEEFASKFGSALVHGIYAADSRQLSVRSAFPTLPETESRGGGRVVAGLFMPSGPTAHDGPDYQLGDILSVMKDASRPSDSGDWNCFFVTREFETEGHYDFDIIWGYRLLNDIIHQIQTTTGEVLTPSHVVSALPLAQLHKLLPQSSPMSLPYLTANPSSSVKVVNFIFPSNSQFHPEGFGYLIPRPKDGYDCSTSENVGILGTVFDSCALAEQDTPLSSTSRSKAPIKVTMMLGGPYEHALAHEIPASTLLCHLSSHLGGVSIPEPIYSRIMHQKDCIPTPSPGHLDRMDELKRTINTGPWQGRLEVIGAGVGGSQILKQYTKNNRDVDSNLLHPSSTSQMSTELATTYAALILADEGIEITSDKIVALTNAAGVEVEPIWASLLAKALEGKNVKDLLSNVGSGGGAPAAAAPAAAAGGAATEAPKEEEKKEEEKEESDDDMGFGLFD